MNSFDNVASDHVVKQEESNSPLAETLKESSSAIGAVVKQEKEEEEDQGQQLNDVPGNAGGVEEEAILEWEDYRNFNCDLDEEAPTLSLSVDKMLQEGKTLTQTDAVYFIEPGEWQERRYTMKLIKNKNTVGKQEEKTSVRNGKEELAWISFDWWKDNDEANLMIFNQLSKFVMPWIFLQYSFSFGFILSISIFQSRMSNVQVKKWPIFVIFYGMLHVAIGTITMIWPLNLEILLIPTCH